MHKSNSTLNTLSSITNQNPSLPLPLLFFGIFVLKEVFLEREAKAFGLQRRKRIFWFLKPDPNMITLTFLQKKGSLFRVTVSDLKSFQDFGVTGTSYHIRLLIHK